MLPESTRSFDSSYRSVEAAKQRLVLWRKRQRNRRDVILQHLASMIYLNWNEYNQSFSEDLQEAIHSRVMELLIPPSVSHRSFDEIAYRKRAILPVITRLRAPTVSRRLLRRIELLLARKLGLSSSSELLHSNALFPSNDLEALSSRWATHTSLLDNSTADTPSVHGGDPLVNRGDGEKRDGEEFMVKTYTGSATFLKGTQSANPHNDYCQHFVDTGERPQNFIRDTGLRNRFEEYPKLRELIRLKDALIHSRATPPMYLRADLKTFDLNDLQCKFDVVLIEPPLEEYHRMNGAVFDQHWTWAEIEQLEIEKIVAPRSFVWIWCGSGEGLDAARRCLRKWGFRRCEDICWIKTNRGRPGHEALEPGAVFQRTKEHCLMGIHGTVRRSTDGDFIHANIDIDLIIEEAPKHGGYAAKDKPTEIFHIIEHFCLGRRRLHLFGRDSTLRAGWLTVGSELSASNFDSRLYASNFAKEPNGLFLGSTDEIERLRPKSPPPRHQNPTANPGTAGTSAGSSNTGGSGLGTGSTTDLGGGKNESNPLPLSGFPNAPGSALIMGQTMPSALHTISLSTSTPTSSALTGPLFSGSGLHSLMSSNLAGVHRRQGQSMGIKSTSFQSSLLGCPSSLSSINATVGARNLLNTRDRNRSNHSAVSSFQSSSHSSRGGASNFHTVPTSLSQQSALHPNLMPTVSGIWPMPNNLAMALAAAGSSGIMCPPSGSLTAAPPALSNPLFRSTGLQDASLLSTLLATGKLSPAILAALSATAGANATNSTFGQGDSNAAMSNRSNMGGNNNPRHHHHHGNWR